MRPGFRWLRRESCFNGKSCLALEHISPAGQFLLPLASTIWVPKPFSESLAVIVVWI